MASSGSCQEPTYDSPAAFLEAMDYTNDAAMDTEALQYDGVGQFRSVFKPAFQPAGPIDPLLSTNEANGFHLDMDYWNRPSQFGSLGMINPDLSPLDGNQSADTGYASQEGSPDKSPIGIPHMLFPESMTVNPKNTSAKPRKRSSTSSTKSKQLEIKPSSRKTRRTSKATAVESMPEGDDDEKRELFLARNREAASKCRQKKKEWTQDLEQRARDLSSQKHMLTTYLAMLKNELLMLKCKCLEHSDCDCEAIRDYLKNTVTNMPPANAALYSKLHGKDASEISGEIARKQSTFDIDGMTPEDMVSSPESNEDGARFLNLEG